MAGIWDWLTPDQQQQVPQFAPNQQPPSPPFVPQTMVQAPVFAQAPQMAQDVAAGIADPLLKAGNYLGGIMQGSQQFSWPETIQHGAALAMAMAPGPKGERLAGGLERGLAGAVEAAAPAGIRAYHGSPYDFPAFDISKIGTGEGAQAYGHGLYFAENEGTAKTYRDLLGARSQNPAAAGTLATFGKNAVEELERRIRTYPGTDIATQAEEQLQAIKSPPGKMYEVNIKAQPEQFLDWDKPLGQQTPQVIEGMHKAGWSVPEKIPTAEELTNLRTKYGDWGKMQADALEATMARPASEFVPKNMQDVEAAAKAGIPGIRYLDQGSRGTGQGTSNYVVFNDQLIDILKKYGLLGTLGAGTAAPYFPRGNTQ